MNSDIVFTDPHIDEECLEELEAEFKEILRSKRGCDTCICIGDLFNKKKPTPKEIEFATKWASIFIREIGKFIIIKGNHDTTSEEINALEYLKYFGVEIVDDLLYKDVYYLHAMTEASAMAFNINTTTISKYVRKLEDLKQYKLVILGHQHQYEKLAENIYHLGSTRYVNFGEIHDKPKRFCIVDNAQITSCLFTTVRPMVEVFSVTELEKISSNSQVLVVIKTFEQFKREAGEINKWNGKFFKIKVKLDIEKKEMKEVAEKTSSNFTEIVKKWLDKVEDADVRSELEDELRAEQLWS